MKLSHATLAIISITAPAELQAAPCGDHEAALRDVKLKTWPDFYRAQDVKGLSAFLTNSFRLIGADGRVSTKAEELDWVAGNPWRPRDFQYQITSIDCPAPGIAVIIGVGRSIRKGENGADVVHGYTSSNVLVLQQGRWRAAASHVSGERSQPVASQ